MLKYNNGDGGDGGDNDDDNQIRMFFKNEPI